MTAAMDAGAPPLFAWDGGRGFAFSASSAAGGRLVLALFAHTDAAQALIALWEGEAGVCAVLLPQGCRHLELHILRGGLPAGIVAVELDELLLPEFIAADLPGLRRVAWSASEGLAAIEGEPPADVRLGLDLAGSSLDGFSRRRIGPLHDPYGRGRRVGVQAEAREGELRLSFANSAAANVLVAHVIGAAKNGGNTDLRRFGDQPDLLGASPFVYWQRGFRLLAPELTEADGDGVLALQPFEAGDEVIVLTPRGWLAVWDGEDWGDAGDRPQGSRMTIAAEPDGGLGVRAVFSAYRPASATALAAIGGGLSAQRGAQGSASLADMAADLAAALWRRSRTPAASTAASTEASPLVAAASSTAPPGLPPLARLTRAGAAAADGLSPILAALGSELGLGAAAIEEIDGLAAADRLALVLWFAADPAIARQAVAQRILLPPPAAAPARERIDAVLAWCADSALGERIEQAALGLAAAGRRDDLLALRRAADAIGEAWLPFTEAAAAETLARPAAEAAAAGPAEALLARLKRDPDALAAAQAEARGLDLAALAERRSRLAEAAAAAGEAPALAADLAKRLASLTATEIALVHRHLHATAGRRRRLDSIRVAVDALDAAAGAEGLARRMDRGGDPLVGMTRLGSASEAAVRALTQATAAHPALAALTVFVDRHAPADEADALLIELRRNLLRYGCLLLSQAVAREAVRAGQVVDPSRRERLLSGAVETLSTLVRAATEALPEGVRLGASLVDRLGAAP
jgi:hypothetical protein